MKKSDVRKLVLLIGFSLLAAQVFAGSYYEGMGLEGKTFLAEEPVLSDYTGATGNALITSLQSEIQNAFPQYTGMKLCTSNSEPADYIIMTVVQQNGNGSFLLTMTIMDPFTEATISCSINNILKENDVYQHALANALLQLVPKLGIKLTSEGLSNLRSLGKIPIEKTTGTAGTTGNKTTDTKQTTSTKKTTPNKYKAMSDGLYLGADIGALQILSAPGNDPALILDAGITRIKGLFGVSLGATYGPDLYCGLTDEVELLADLSALRLGLGVGTGFLFIGNSTDLTTASFSGSLSFFFEGLPVRLKMKYQYLTGLNNRIIEAKTFSCSLSLLFQLPEK